MATVLPLFDLGRAPTTRDVAKLVKAGGLEALPDARRRGDAATYQEIRCRSALNRVKGKAYMQWSLNPYRGCTHGCHYCFARRYHSHLELDAGDQFASVIFVKINFVEVLRRELARPAWNKESAGFGTATDPYQPIEGTYKISRGVLEALRDFSSPVGIVTKGPMIVRDIDVLVEAARRASVSVTFSIPTLDEEVWRKTEPSTAHPRQRLKAVSKLVDAGIKTGVGMAPILPGISDRAEQLREVVKAAREAGATGVWTNLLFLRPGTREHFLEHLAEDWPELVPKYRELYSSRAYLGADDVKPVKRRVAALARELGVADRRVRPVEPEAEPEQLALAV